MRRNDERRGLSPFICPGGRLFDFEGAGRFDEFFGSFLDAFGHFQVLIQLIAQTFQLRAVSIHRLLVQLRDNALEMLDRFVDFLNQRFALLELDFGDIRVGLRFFPERCDSSRCSMQSLLTRSTDSSTSLAATSASRLGCLFECLVQVREFSQQVLGARFAVIAQPAIQIGQHPSLFFLLRFEQTSKRLGGQFAKTKKHATGQRGKPATRIRAPPGQQRPRPNSNAHNNAAIPRPIGNPVSGFLDESMITRRRNSPQSSQSKSPRSKNSLR